MHHVKLVALVVFLTGALLSSGHASQAIDRPIPIRARIPAYPAIAKAKRISGVVLVDVKVNGEGNVIEAAPIMGHEYLRNAAKAASLLWQFKRFECPYSPYTVRLTFIFHDETYEAPEKKPDYRSPYQMEILISGGVAHP